MRARSGQSLAAAGLILPVFFGCAGLGWLWTALGGAAAGLTLWLLERCRLPAEGACPGPCRGAVVLAALVLLPCAAFAARLSAAAFPQTAGSPVAALLILGLAAAAAQRGAERLDRCAAVLLRLCAILLGAVLVFSAPQAKPEWLVPELRPWEGVLAYALLLLPGLLLWLRPAGRTPGRAFAVLPCAAAVPAVTAGVLSPVLARRPYAFLTLAKSVSILGVMRRFEALACAGLLTGGFCLTALLLSCLETACRRALPGREKALRITAAAAAAGLVFVDLNKAGLVLLALAPTFCVLAPVLVQAVGSKKSLRKNKKKT